MVELFLSFKWLLVVVVLFLVSAIKILKEYERGVIFLLGRFQKVKGPGIIIVIPGFQQMVKVSLRMIVMDVPPQDIITKDNVSVKVNAIIYFRVIDSEKAIIQVEDYLYATSQIAQTTLRSVLGQSQLDDLLAKREEINANLQQIIDQQTEPWGIKVSAVEVKNVDLPQEMIRAIAKQAEAERTRRAKIIHAEGEQQAAEQLAEAANILSRTAGGIQLRYLQTLTEIAGENSSTTIFPVPMEFLEPFLKNKMPGK